MRKLKTNTWVPKYEQIKNIICSEISKGKYTVGKCIPSENELPKLFNVSKNTVLKAVGDLVNDGILYREQGKGTFVAISQILKSKRYKSIGLYLAALGTQLTPSKAPDHYAIVHGIINAAGDRGYNTVILGKRDTNLNLERIKHSRINGLIISGVSIDIPAYRRFVPVLKNKNIPYILMNRYEIREDINYIEECSSDEIFNATKYLIKLGHRRIAGIGRRSDYLTFQNFYSGFRRALQEKNIYDPLLVGKIKKNTEKELLKIIKIFYSQKNPPTAIFLFFPTPIDNLLLALKKYGLHIPKDVSLLTIGNKQIIRNKLKITTAGVISKIKFGETAANSLIDLIEGKIKLPINIKLKLKLLKGESCRNL